MQAMRPIESGALDSQHSTLTFYELAFDGGESVRCVFSFFKSLNTQ
jgi:hypothetical protein